MRQQRPVRQFVTIAAAVVLLAAAARGDNAAGGSGAAEPQAEGAALAGDYFVGASVFLFERTVLSAFAPAGVTDSMLDGGAIYLARETAADESGSVALDALLGWLGAWFATGNGGGRAATDPPGFGPERRRALACLIYGGDPENDAALAERAGIGADDRPDCVARYADARKKWTAWLQPFRKTADSPAPMRAAPEGAPSEGAPLLRLAFAPTLDEANQAIADAMRKNGLFQALTDDFNAGLAMPRPITALLTQCGEPKAFYNPDRGEAVICYELLAKLLQAAPK